MNINGQVEWPCSKVTQIQHFQTSFLISWESISLIEAKFHVEPHWDEGMSSNGPGHMTKMAAIPIYGKKMKNSASLELKGWWLESLYAASGTQVLPSLFKLRP